MKNMMTHPFSTKVLQVVKSAGQQLWANFVRVRNYEGTPVAIKRIVLALMCLLAGSIIVFASSTLLESAVRHEEEMKYLSDQYDAPSSISNIIDWDLGEQPIGRPFTATDGAIIGEALTKAWQNLLLAKRSRNEKFLDDFFVGSALSNSLDTLAENIPGTEKGLVFLRQEFKPRFFHLDGSVLELVSDNSVSVRYEIDEKADEINFLSVNKECPRLIMFLETVGWKISNQELDCIEKLNGESKRKSLREIKFPLKGLNYYPANTPWLDFWKNYDDKIILQDLITMHDLGVDTIRVFLPYEYFLDPKTSVEARQKFDRFLTFTKSERINVIPTLFDFRNYYDPIEWAYEYAYMIGILEVIKKHDNVTLIDLKNEPDLDYEAHGRAAVDMWLITFSRLLEHLLPEIPVTIGWLSHEHAARMSHIVDVVSYHEYGDPSKSAEIYNQTKAASNGKPVIISEIGQPSWSLFAGIPFSPESQANWLKLQLDALKHADGVLIWTMHDFSYEAVGRVAELPWRRAMQAHFGIFDRQGNAKPVVEIFRQYNLSNGDKTTDHEGHNHDILNSGASADHKEEEAQLIQDEQPAQEKPLEEPQSLDGYGPLTSETLMTE